MLTREKIFLSGNKHENLFPKINKSYLNSSGGGLNKTNFNYIPGTRDSELLWAIENEDDDDLYQEVIDLFVSNKWATLDRAKQTVLAAKISGRSPAEVLDEFVSYHKEIKEQEEQEILFNFGETPNEEMDRKMSEYIDNKFEDVMENIPLQLKNEFNKKLNAVRNESKEKLDMAIKEINFLKGKIYEITGEEVPQKKEEKKGGLFSSFSTIASSFIPQKPSAQEQEEEEESYQTAEETEEEKKETKSISDISTVLKTLGKQLEDYGDEVTIQLKEHYNKAMKTILMIKEKFDDEYTLHKYLSAGNKRLSAGSEGYVVVTYKHDKKYYLVDLKKHKVDLRGNTVKLLFDMMKGVSDGLSDLGIKISPSDKDFKSIIDWLGFSESKIETNRLFTERFMEDLIIHLFIYEPDYKTEAKTNIKFKKEVAEYIGKLDEIVAKDESHGVIKDILNLKKTAKKTQSAAGRALIERKLKDQEEVYQNYEKFTK